MMICLPAKILKFQLGMYMNVHDYVHGPGAHKVRWIVFFDVG